MATATVVTPKKENAVYINDGGKKILDPVHGTMAFHEVIVRVIDTPELQRLRNIKQRAGTNYVFSGGIHTRFDHSLGTAYLSGNLLKSLREKEKDIEITDKNVLCVQIAGLCHDLGQGPFSRVYKHEYLGKLKQTEWNQCEAAVKIFDIILEKEKIKSVFKKYGICEEDIVFIKHAMTGKIPQNPKEHRFLYEIVKNKRNGVDCATLDTIQRDCYFVGIKKKLDIARYFLKTRIHKVENEYRLCFEEEEATELKMYFHTLLDLQERLYQHRDTVAIRMMLADAVVAADAVFPELFAAHQDPNMLLYLCDNSIVDKILYTDDARLAKAKQIIEKIEQKDLYVFCGEGKLGIVADTYEERYAFCGRVASVIARQDCFIKEDDIVVEILDSGVGVGNENPLKNIDFVDKNGNLVSPTTERGFEQLSCTRNCQYIRVYARNEENKVRISKLFKSWHEMYKEPHTYIQIFKKLSISFSLAVTIYFMLKYAKKNR